MVSLLNAKNEFVVENAISALKNCAANGTIKKYQYLPYSERNIVELRELKFITRLVQLLTNKNENILREAILCMKNMCMNEENSAQIGKQKGVELLLQIVNTSKSDAVRKAAVLTIQALARNSENIKIIETLKATPSTAQR